MARPRKNNADYFSHDYDMRNDDRILAVRNKFEHLGFSIYNMMLEKLTEADNFELKYDNKQLELWAGDFRNILGAELKEIIDYFLELGLFSENEDGFIFSLEHKHRLQSVLNKRDRERTKSADRERDGEGKFVPDNSKSGGVSAADTPQRKVKESKGKESIISELRSPSQKAIDFFDLVKNGGDRYEKFIDSLADRGADRNVAELNIKKFASYWTELNKSGKKQRWQMEKTFEVQKRWVTWTGNIKGYSNDSRTEHQKRTDKKTDDILNQCGLG